MLSQNPLRWILTSAILSKKTNYFTVCNCKILPNIVCLSKFAFRLLEISFVDWQHKIQQASTKLLSRPVPEIRPSIPKRLSQCLIFYEDLNKSLDETYGHSYNCSDSRLYRTTRDSGDSAT